VNRVHSACANKGGYSWRLQSFWTECRVDWYVCTTTSAQTAPVSIYRLVQEHTKQKKATDIISTAVKNLYIKILVTNYSSRSQTLQTRTEQFVVYHCCVPLRVSVCPSLSHSWNLTHSKTCFGKTKYEPPRVERTNITVYKHKHVKL